MGIADAFKQVMDGLNSAQAQGAFNGIKGAAAVADTFQAFSNDQAQALLGTLLPWAANVARHGARKWKDANEYACAIDLSASSRCGLPATVRCELCKRPACLNHAFVAFDGTAICWACAKEAAKHIKPIEEPFRRAQQEADRARARSSSDSLDWAYTVLKVKIGASNEALKRAHKTMSRKHHPDLFSEPDEKRRNEEIFKSVQKAWEAICAQRGIS